jgi:hypothetical protein
VLGLRVEDAIVVHNSNRIAVRLVPCNALARVAIESDRRGADFEVDIAQRLADTDSPVALLEPRVAPAVYVHEGFVLTFWAYHELLSPPEVGPGEFAEALAQIHAGMRKIAHPPAPHFTDRVEAALRVVRNPDQSPELEVADRHLLRETLERVTRDIGQRGAAEQLLHGEPHPGNLMRTKDGLLFVDLETCCRGPVEFDVAHAPEEVGEQYPELDQDLVRDCRILMLAMITTWRWDRRDQLPDGRYLGIEWLNQLRAAVDL